MARPAKPISVATGERTKERILMRNATETAITGSSDKLDPPEYLTDEEKAVYGSLLKQLEPVGVSNVDIFTLVKVSTAVVRLREIENRVRDGGLPLLDKDLIRVRRSYQQELEKGFRELALSQNAGSMLTKLADQAADREQDPVLKILKDA